MSGSMRSMTLPAKDNEGSWSSGRHHTGIRPLRPAGGFPMSAVETMTSTEPYRLREFHAFESADTHFYLVRAARYFLSRRDGHEILERLAGRAGHQGGTCQSLLALGRPLSEINRRWKRWNTPK